MTFYIRPRQDLSLATFSRVLLSLYDKGLPHKPTLVINPDSGKREVMLEVVTKSKIIVEAMINCICDYLGCRRSDYKIIEVAE